MTDTRSVPIDLTKLDVKIMETATQIRKRVTWTATMKHMMNLTHRTSDEKTKIINYFTFIAEK